MTTSLDFNKLKHAVTQQFANISRSDLFCVEIDRDEIWQTYLNAFPAGTNPIFRERTEHDCSCCRSFIRTIGGAVTIDDKGKVVSLWDFVVDDPAYAAVAKVMSEYVHTKAIDNQFIHFESKVGTDQNREQTEDGTIITWKHFYVDLPRRNSGVPFFMDNKAIGTKLGEIRGNHDVFLRGVVELTVDAVETVVDIIKQGSLYRGNEYAEGVQDFLKLKRQFDKLAPDQRDGWVWANANKKGARIRNTAIGTLLIDLSDGKDLEEAVRKFETSIMAPTSFKRPTALVSPKMVEAAKDQVEKLGLTSALSRRYASLTDISVKDIIFADRSASKAMKDGDPFADIATKASTPKDLGKIEEMPIEKFIKDVVPNINSLEIMVENKHTPNFVSLIAPVDQDAGRLFKWGNNFSWSYNGDMADSIKERVKQAGGNVTGDLCCRLAWFNYDDLDFHLIEPGAPRHSKYEIYFRTRGSASPGGGRLDVDMNAGGGSSRTPVENIFYATRRTMKEGEYELSVNQFARRESKDIGFEVEIDFLGDVQRFVYDKAVSGRITVAKFKYTHANGIEMIQSLQSTQASREIWGVKTQAFQKVNVLMRSPNHWDGEKVGNQHYFFMLDDCQNEGQARGFFNEFLKDDLEKHRKVLEIVGSKMKTEETPNQLSGLGFSDTKRAEIIARVKGNFTRTIKVMV
jgi:hypothetical protein